MNKPKNAISMTVDLYQNRSLVRNFSKNDFKTKFAGSYLGIVWAFVQPVVTILVYWFVFEIGLKAGRDCQYPFIVWLTAGLVPWFFFSEAWNSGTNALIEYRKEGCIQNQHFAVCEGSFFAFCASDFCMYSDCFKLGLWIYSGFVFLAAVVLHFLQHSAHPWPFVSDICGRGVFP